MLIDKTEVRMMDLAPKVKRTDAIQSFVSQDTPIVTIADGAGESGIGVSWSRAVLKAGSIGEFARQFRAKGG